MLYGLRSVMGIDMITEINFTKHYFDVDKTIDWFIENYETARK